jgi:hypothetical protein
MLIVSSNRHTVLGVSHRTYPRVRHSISKWSFSKSKVLSLKLLNPSRLGSERGIFRVSIVLSLSQHSILYAFFARSSCMRLLILLVPLSVAFTLPYVSVGICPYTDLSHSCHRRHNCESLLEVYRDPTASPNIRVIDAFVHVN